MMTLIPGAVLDNYSKAPWLGFTPTNKKWACDLFRAKQTASRFWDNSWLSEMATLRRHIPNRTLDLLFFFFWVSDTTFRCLGDNYRKRKIELLAFSLPASGRVGVAVKRGNYLAKLAYYNSFFSNPFAKWVIKETACWLLRGVWMKVSDLNSWCKLGLMLTVNRNNSGGFPEVTARQVEWRKATMLHFASFWLA